MLITIDDKKLEHIIRNHLTDTLIDYISTYTVPGDSAEVELIKLQDEILKPMMTEIRTSAIVRR